MGIKDEEMEGLSDEERAALEDDEDDSDIISKIAGGDGNDDDDDEAGEGNGSGDGADSAASDDSAGESDAAKADAGTDGGGGKGKGDAGGDTDGDDTAVAMPDEFQPQFTSAVPEGLTDKLTALETQSKNLLAEFKEGNIDMPEFMAQKEAIDAEKLALTLADAQAKWAQDQNENSRDQRWKWEQERFFGSAKADIYKDPVILAALDASVKMLATDPANAKKPSAFFLEEADRQVRSRFNMGESTPKPKVVAKREPDLSNVPKTLANLPAAEMAETGEAEFAYLDKMDGIALEAALRKMTPEQEARYLGAA